MASRWRAATNRGGKSVSDWNSNDESQDDLYSGYNDTDDHYGFGRVELNAGWKNSCDVERTIGDQAPYGDRPSTSMSGLSAVENSRPVPTRTTGTSAVVLTPGMSGPIGSRPMTAVRAAGFASRKMSLCSIGGTTGSTGRSDGGGRTAACRMTSSSLSMSSAGKKSMDGDGAECNGGSEQPSSPDSRFRRLERTINQHLDDSCCANARGDMKTALQKAKVS